jgi:hypothetical protein
LSTTRNPPDCRVMKILQISVFYKNDSPLGFGFTLTEDFGDLNLIYDATVESYETEYRQAVHRSSTQALIADMFRQLDTIGRLKLTGIEAVSIALGNIYILEKYGYLKSDEFNGILTVRQQS